MSNQVRTQAVETMAAELRKLVTGGDAVETNAAVDYAQKRAAGMYQRVIDVATTHLPRSVAEWEQARKAAFEGLPKGGAGRVPDSAVNAASVVKRALERGVQLKPGVSFSHLRTQVSLAKAGVPASKVNSAESAGDLRKLREQARPGTVHSTRQLPEKVAKALSDVSSALTGAPEAEALAVLEKAAEQLRGMDTGEGRKPARKGDAGDNRKVTGKARRARTSRAPARRKGTMEQVANG